MNAPLSAIGIAAFRLLWLSVNFDDVQSPTGTTTGTKISGPTCGRDRMQPGPHRDPFDRMLIAQAHAEDQALVSNERVLDAYGVRRVW
jgi:PIN domain nuclease of toxin-antitoxin system